MNLQNILNSIEDRKDELFDILCDLIEIPSENRRYDGDEKAVAEYMHKQFTALGLESDIYSPMDLPDFDKHPDYMAGRNLENRPNVSARWKGVEDEDSLMLMGHSDTVEVGNLDNWTRDPFCAAIENGNIYGRGASDDKYALATQLFLLRILKDAGFVPKKNIIFTAYCDEEHGGSHGALAAVLKYPCPHIINMDCGQNEVWHCASGGQGTKYLFHTEQPTDSAKQAAQALPIVLEVIERFAANRKKELSENRFYADTDVPETSLRYMNVRAGYDCTDLGCGEVAFTYYTDKTKEEIMAELAEMEKELSERLAPLGIIGDGFSPRTRFFHYVYCEPDSQDILAILNAAKIATGEDLSVCGSCLSDLSVISKYGSSNAFAFGLGRGFSLPGGSHQPDEYIECDELVKFAKIILTYIVQTLG